MDNVINIDDFRKHRANLTECNQCGKVWVAVFPEIADDKKLECPDCESADSSILDDNSVGCGICKKSGKWDHSKCFDSREKI